MSNDTLEKQPPTAGPPYPAHLDLERAVNEPDPLPLAHPPRSPQLVPSRDSFVNGPVPHLERLPSPVTWPHAKRTLCCGGKPLPYHPSSSGTAPSANTHTLRSHTPEEFLDPDFDHPFLSKPRHVAYCMAMDWESCPPDSPQVDASRPRPLNNPVHTHPPSIPNRTDCIPHPHPAYTIPSPRPYHDHPDHYHNHHLYRVHNNHSPDMDTDMDMDMDVSTRLLRATAALSALTTAEDPPSADAIPTTTTTTTTIDTVPIQASLAALREAELQQKSTSKFGLDDGEWVTDSDCESNASHSSMKVEIEAEEFEQFVFYRSV